MMMGMGNASILLMTAVCYHCIHEHLGRTTLYSLSMNAGRCVDSWIGARYVSIFNLHQDIYQYIVYLYGVYMGLLGKYSIYLRNIMHETVKSIFGCDLSKGDWYDMAIMTDASIQGNVLAIHVTSILLPNVLSL